MASSDTHRGRAGEAHVKTFDVTVVVEFTEPCSPEDLEDRAIVLLEAIEQHASHIALGAVVGGNHVAHTVEIDFDVEASGLSRMQAKVLELLEILERETPGSFETGSVHAEPSRAREPELAGV